MTTGGSPTPLDINDPIKEDVASALAISVAIWKDATPTVTFPNMTELAKIELGRLLGVTLKNPSFRSLVSPGTRALLTKEPWDVPEPADLLETFVKDVRCDAYMHHLIGREILAEGHKDAAFEMVCRRGLPPTAHMHDFESLTKQTAKTLGVTWKMSICTTASDLYGALYARLKRM
jgi:hypothetical protein